MGALKDIAFAAPPPVGLALTVRGQRYDALKVEPHTRRDGVVIELVTWASHCATCGCEMTFRSSALRLPETRRCPEHRQPGKALPRPHRQIQSEQSIIDKE